MITWLKKISVLLLLCLFYSCGSHKSIYIDESVQKNSISDSFSLVAIDKSWIYENSQPNMNPKEREIFINELERALLQYTKGSFSIIKPDEEMLFEYSKYEPMLLDGGKITINVNVPAYEVLKNVENRYILFFEDHHFRTREVTDNAGSSYAGHEPQTYNTLSLNTEFYVWDKEENKAINWGEISQQTKVGSEPKTEDYRIVVSKVVKEVITNSVFQ